MKPALMPAATMINRAGEGGFMTEEAAYRSRAIKRISRLWPAFGAKVPAKALATHDLKRTGGLALRVSVFGDKAAR